MHLTLHYHLPQISPFDLNQIITLMNEPSHNLDPHPSNNSTQTYMKEDIHFFSFSCNPQIVITCIPYPTTPFISQLNIMTLTIPFTVYNPDSTPKLLPDCMRVILRPDAGIVLLHFLPRDMCPTSWMHELLWITGTIISALAKWGVLFLWRRKYGWWRKGNPVEMDPVLMFQVMRLTL